MVHTILQGNHLKLVYIFLTCGLLILQHWLITTEGPSPTICSVNMVELPAMNKTYQASSDMSLKEKPVLLIWLWPFGKKFGIQDCKTYFNIDSCVLTDNRSLYSVADAVLLHHESIHDNSDNIPLDPRPPFQKWIWLNNESPTITIKKPRLDDLFNLTLSFRHDLGITLRYELSVVRNPVNFVMPLKNKTVCWISSNNRTIGSVTRMRFYQELKKHIEINVYGRGVAGASFLPLEDYYSMIASCKFYLSFENALHEDYITEKFNGPMAAGTVPVVLGATRKNYEQVAPADSFIHTDDFPSPKALADYLHLLDKNDTMYMRYFSWRQYLKATPHLLSLDKEFMLPICEACRHISVDNSYNVVHDLYGWYHKPGRWYHWQR